ncbi:MAG TPA: response regulator [Methylomirabilota bacterium]|nr:response regulator [Methylomirabilota bacterium]
MSAPSPRPLILVVDDEHVIAQLIADLLSAEGYQVDTAPDGIAALEQIARRTYDLILSDLRMPELDGLGLFRALEEKRPELARRFVFVTGTSEHSDYRGFVEDVPAPVLTKPFDMDDLLRVVREMLAVPAP